MFSPLLLNIPAPNPVLLAPIISQPSITILLESKIPIAFVPFSIEQFFNRLSLERSSIMRIPPHYNLLASNIELIASKRPLAHISQPSSKYSFAPLIIK